MRGRVSHALMRSRVISLQPPHAEYSLKLLKKQKSLSVQLDGCFGIKRCIDAEAIRSLDVERFTEGLRSCINGALMPKFRFVFHEDTKREEVGGIELRDHEEALAEARRAAHETIIDEVLEGVNPTRWVVRVYNDTGQLIGTIFFADLLKSAPGS
jgi:hypothetical protein